MRIKFLYCDHVRTGRKNIPGLAGVDWMLCGRCGTLIMTKAETGIVLEIFESELLLEGRREHEAERERHKRWYEKKKAEKGE